MKENFWDKLMEDDDHAAVYMDTYGEGPGAETRHFLGSFINDGESVLDVGCGPGWNLDHFIEYGPKISTYYGVDYSQRFVRVANDRHRRNSKTMAFGIVDSGDDPIYGLGDARSLEQPDESFDVVILQDCLEHTNGYEKPVREALRVAKKRIIIAFWHLDYTDNEHINDDGDDGWGAWYDKAAWEKFLDSLDLHWLHADITVNNHVRDFYIIDKEAQHG